jgi:hypothetical protein
MTGHFTATVNDFVGGVVAPTLAVEKKPDTYADVFKTYLSTSTILGVNFAFSSPYFIQRCIWVVILCAGLAATGYHSYTNTSYASTKNVYFNNNVTIIQSD